MRSFHNSFRARQQMICFSQSEVQEVLRQSTYASTIDTIADIQKRHDHIKNVNAPTNDRSNPIPNEQQGKDAIQKRDTCQSFHEAA